MLIRVSLGTLSFFFGRVLRQTHDMYSCMQIKQIAKATSYYEFCLKVDNKQIDLYIQNTNLYTRAPWKMVDNDDDIARKNKLYNFKIGKICNC